MWHEVCELFKDEKLTPKQALYKIQMLKNTFFGDREALHKEIDEIISKVK